MTSKSNSPHASSSAGSSRLPKGPSSSSHNAAASLKSINSIFHSHTFRYYTLLPAIILTIITILSTDLHAWHLSEIHHFYIELFAVILGSILAFYYIARAHSLDDNFSRFIGFGFLASALIDMLHVMVTFAYIDNVTFTKYFIPQTWFAGRIVLSAMLVLAISKYPKFSKEEKIKNQRLSQEVTEFSTEIKSEESLYQTREQVKGEHKSKIHFTGLTSVTESPYKTFLIYFTFLSALSGIVAISSLFIVFPYSVLDYFFVHRPYELPCLILFIVALILFYKNGLYKKTDVFFKGILAYLIIDIYAQIIMSFSANSFDTAHMVAHVLKDAGYFVNIIALAVSSIQYNVRLRESNWSLIDSNIRLKEREEIIHVQLEQLRESEKLKDEFINTAAHELRTPIQPILGLTNIISSKVTELINMGSSQDHQGEADPHLKISKIQQEQQLLDLIAVITRNAKRLRQLSENILDATKIESHTLKINKEQFDIRQLIAETLREQNDSIKASGTRIEILCMADQKNPTDIDSSPTKIESDALKSTEGTDHRVSACGNDSYFVNADRIKISQVLNNLLSNSLRAIRAKAGDSSSNQEGGRIAILIEINSNNGKEKEVQARVVGHNNNNNNINRAEIIVSLRDNGIGLSPEIIPKLFTKFAPGADSGTGLGLYISKNIVEAHGGRIWANDNSRMIGNRPEPFGATFSFSLPVQEIET